VRANACPSSVRAHIVSARARRACARRDTALVSPRWRRLGRARPSAWRVGAGSAPRRACAAVRRGPYGLVAVGWGRRAAPSTVSHARGGKAATRSRWHQASLSRGGEDRAAARCVHKAGCARLEGNRSRHRPQRLRISDGRATADRQEKYPLTPAGPGFAGILSRSRSERSAATALLPTRTDRHYLGVHCICFPPHTLLHPLPNKLLQTRLRNEN
jgi:hypothetical protein